MTSPEDSTIQTEIESDAHYRNRLKAAGGLPDAAALDMCNVGSKLDEIGARHKVYRIHTHICAPIRDVGEK